MPRRHNNLPVDTQNPFDNLGIDKAFLEVLVKNGDDAVLMTALSGFKRVVARVLHPDSGMHTEEAHDYLNTFMQAYSRIDDMPAEGVSTLAKAHVRRRGSAKPRPKPEYFESEDFHDGSLLSGLIDMVAQSGESIPSLRNKRILVRPLDFRLTKPDNATGGSYQWYPPETARIGMFETDERGKTKWTAMRQTSFGGMLRKELRTNDVKDELKSKLTHISSEYWPMIESVVDHSQITKKATVTMVQKDGYLDIHQPSGDRAGTYKTDNTLRTELEDGIYSFGFEDISINGYASMHDGYYIFEDDTEQKDGIMIAGFSDQSFLTTQRKQIFADPEKSSGILLPSTSRSGDDIYSFSVPEKMRKYVQKSYTPNIPSVEEKPLTLATNTNGEILILGKLINSTSIA